jgi:hypothetical protein
MCFRQGLFTHTCQVVKQSCDSSGCVQHSWDLFLFAAGMLLVISRSQYPENEHFLFVLIRDFIYPISSVLFVLSVDMGLVTPNTTRFIVHLLFHDSPSTEPCPQNLSHSGTATICVFQQCRAKDLESLPSQNSLLGGEFLFLCTYPEYSIFLKTQDI